MPWKKGQSGNPHGRAITIAQKLIDANIGEPSENVYIPILDKRDPVKELIKLADKAADKEFKKNIWIFLVSLKYKAVRIVSKPVQKPVESAESDADMLRALEENRPVKSNPSASNG